MIAIVKSARKYVAFWLIAGTSLGAFAEPKDLPQTGRAILRFERASYTGGKVSGTLLVGAVGGIVLVPAWATEPYNFSLEDVSECDTGRKVRRWTADPVGNLPERAPVKIEPGYWYGKDVEYPLFGDRAGPNCIEFTIAFQSGAQRRAAELRLRITSGGRAKVLSEQ